MTPEYQAELIRITKFIIAGTGAPDHLHEFPWLVGALGDPRSPVWFIAENPSLTMVERARDPDGGEPTIEAQWYASRGDKLFREMLYKHGFKTTPPDKPGGWRCYITNLIKEPDYASRWRASSQARRNEAADVWSVLLDWELSNGDPQTIVAMGRTVEKVLRRLSRDDLVLPSDVLVIDHYSYIAHRPEGHLGPMHPERVARYDEAFRRIARMHEQESRAPSGATGE